MVLLFAKRFVCAGFSLDISGFFFYIVYIFLLGYLHLFILIVQSPRFGLALIWLIDLLMMGQMNLDVIQRWKCSAVWASPNQICTIFQSILSIFAVFSPVKYTKKGAKCFIKCRLLIFWIKKKNKRLHSLQMLLMAFSGAICGK